MRTQVYLVLARALMCVALMGGICGVVEAQIRWSTPQPVWAEGAQSGGAQRAPVVASDGAETLVAAWEQGTGLVSARSTDGGLTWSAAAEVPESSAHRLPRAQEIVYTGDSWVLYWRVWNRVTLTVEECFFSRSSDGSSWSAPVSTGMTFRWGSVSDNQLRANGGDMASDSSGTVVALIDAGIVYRSTDSGVSWTSSALMLTQEPQYESRRLAVAFDSGKWYLMVSGRSEYFEQEQFTCVFVSTDGGVTWIPRDGASQVPEGRDLAARDGTVVILSGANYYVSQDDGITWSGGGQTDEVPIGVERLFVDSHGHWLASRAVTYDRNTYLVDATTDPAAGWTSIDYDQIPARPSDPSFAEVTSGIIMLSKVNMDFSTWPVYEQQVISQLSQDGGVTWSEPAYTNGRRMPAQLRQTDVVLASGENGNVCALWNAGGWMVAQTFTPQADEWSSAAVVLPKQLFSPYSISIVPGGSQGWLASIREFQFSSEFEQTMSNEDGTTWTALGQSPADPVAWSKHGTIIGATPYPQSQYFLYRFDPVLRNWTKVQEFVDAPLAVVHTSGKKWFGIIGPDLYTSEDDGLTWTRRRNFGGDFYFDLKLAADHRGVAMALVDVVNGRGGLDTYSITLRDNGLTWAEPTLIKLDRQQSIGDRTALVPLGPGVWVAAFNTSGLGISTYFTDDDGATWKPVPLTGPTGKTIAGEFIGFMPALAASGNTAILAYRDMTTDTASYTTVKIPLPKAAAHSWELFE